MSSQDYQQRFGGLQRLYGDAGFARLAELHFCVIGIGGVGSWVVEAFARSGIGHLTLVDYDEIALSNVNRQLHSLTGTLGQKKIAVMKERVLQINPDCQLDLIDNFLIMDNHIQILSRGYDYVVDAIDSIKFKAAMIYYCKRNKIPLVTTGGAGGLTDVTQLAITDLSRTHNDALAAKVRARLRSDYGFSRNPKRRFGVDCVFSSQQPVYPKDDGSVSYEKPGIHGLSLDCSLGYGASACVTASFGFMAASHTINKTLAKSLKKSP
ncbi:HesA/MoeB/ThiF family protein =_ sulfur transfer pathway protein CsdL [hydrothermal vent metagenome]|uniref:HesA/MoeB/ThiF family protein => sulfur transfer pathway protein CsdL n=1 Tax=hydrothermal vent metagenome TaxID=652676 RepID=A0A3B1B9G3_9ZZZZ